MMRKLKELLRGVLVPLALLVIWEFCSRAGFVSEILLPAPSAVAAKWWQSLLPAQAHDAAAQSWLAWAFSGELIHDAMSSLYRVVVGFVVGAGLALPVGLVM